MERIGLLALQSLVVLATASLNVAHAQAELAARHGMQPRDKPQCRPPVAPQDFVVCTGWHALCSASHDCRMHGDKADCDCLRVNETHIVETDAIQDVEAKQLTRVQCTERHPCAVDQAPVCKVIQDGQYQVGQVKYEWVSTYSYRGWCSLLNPKPAPCDQNAPGYAGDRYWAICDAAPCTELPNPPDPNRPLRCECRVENTPFLGPGGRCIGDNGGIISSSPLAGWDFKNNTYTFPMPGYEYVQGACAPLKSDPPKETQQRTQSR